MKAPAHTFDEAPVMAISTVRAMHLAQNILDRMTWAGP